MRSSRNRSSSARVKSAALPAESLEHAFPELDLALQPPYPAAEARSVKEVPRGAGWLYEPKWDGFRCLAFRSGNDVALQSKAGQPLTRYFPEIVEALRALAARSFVLDGEIVVTSSPVYKPGRHHGAALDFDALLQRIHPAASRIQRLAAETPATYMVFDLLLEQSGRLLAGQPLSERREELHRFAERYFNGNTGVRLSPATMNFVTAEKWMPEGAASGWDGIVAKRIDCEYTSGERTGMVKIKRIRSADCVVAGFRWLRGSSAATQGKRGMGKQPEEETVGSLLLGLYNEHGQLDHVGFSSSFNREDRRELKAILKPLIAGPPRNGGDSGPGGFTGKSPGGPSRWTKDDRDTAWVPLKPKLVGEFQYDHFSGGRFRHGTKLLRWRPEKKPQQCTTDQLRLIPTKAA